MTPSNIPSNIPSSIHAFVAQTGADDLPPAVRRQAERCVLDLAGAAIAGRATPVSRIIHDHAVRYFAAGEGAVPRAPPLRRKAREPLARLLPAA